MSSVNGLQMQKCITSVSCCLLNPDTVCLYHYNTRICMPLIIFFSFSCPVVSQNIRNAAQGIRKVRKQRQASGVYLDV